MCNGGGRIKATVEKLADTYDRDLFSGMRLADLRSGPRIYFNATNLSTGNLFFFVIAAAAGFLGREAMSPFAKSAAK